MKLVGLSERILVAWGLFICASCVLAAPVAIGFIAPDEEPRYTNLVSGLRQGLQLPGWPDSETGSSSLGSAMPV